MGNPGISSGSVGWPGLVGNAFYHPNTAVAANVLNGGLAQAYFAAQQNGLMVFDNAFSIRPSDGDGGEVATAGVNRIVTTGSWVTIAGGMRTIAQHVGAIDAALVIKAPLSIKGDTIAARLVMSSSTLGSWADDEHSTTTNITPFKDLLAVADERNRNINPFRGAFQIGCAHHISASYEGQTCFVYLQVMSTTPFIPIQGSAWFRSLFT